MGSALSGLCRAVYATVLGLNMVWSTALMRLVYLLPMSKQTREKCCLVLVQAAWRFTIFLTPWVWMQADGDFAGQWEQILDFMGQAADEAQKLGKPTPPLFVLGNHVSFLDSLLAASKFPTRALVRCRTYMDHHLFKLPILATVCRSVGHFPVYFKSAQDGVFKVDNEKMEEVDKKVTEHLNNGGWLCFFPEGQMNKNPDVLLPFRYGGIKKAVELDARLATFICYGNNHVWPRNAVVGGSPGRVYYSMGISAPKGARALAAELREQAPEEEKGLEDHELLAKHLRTEMQREYDVLKQQATGGKPALKAA